MLINIIGGFVLLYVLTRPGIFLKAAPVGLFVLAVYLIGGLLFKVLAAVWLPLLLVTGAYIAVFRK